MSEPFRALVVEQADGRTDVRLTTMRREELLPGEVVVRVGWSSVNYKDALATSPTGNVARISPLVPGIDLAGEVVESSAAEFTPGDEVLVHGYELGVSHHGGYAQYARVPAAWVLALPEGLSPRQAMALGTAGYTAAMSVLALERQGLAPGSGPVLVLGATGGVGAVALNILAGRGYEVVASTGKGDRAAWLRDLGARDVLDRAETSEAAGPPLGKGRWAGCVDPVGGDSLAYVLRTLRAHGVVVSSGLTGGVALRTTVLPFILRGVALLGVDSAHTPMPERREIWRRVATDLRPPALDAMTREVALDDLPGTLAATLAGGSVGRTVVRIAGDGGEGLTAGGGQVRAV